MKRSELKRGEPLKRKTRLLAKSGPVVLTCQSCGNDWTYHPPYGSSYRPKACSPTCVAALKRKGNGDRRGKSNPNHRHGRRAGERDRAGEARWYAAAAERCEHPCCPAPGGGSRGLSLHHIVYRQHVRRASGDVWDPRNALTLCDCCHLAHHRRGRLIPTSVLPDAALDFAFELLGPAAFDYLTRRYGPPDDRLLDRLALAEGAA